MKNKKILIAIIVVLVLIAVTAIGILVLKNSEEKDSIKEDNTSKVVEKNEVANTKNDEKDVDYKGIIKKFLVACDSEDDMDDFVDEYVDIKSLYVINSVGSFSEFMDEYEKTKSKDYKDYIDDVKEQFADFVDSEEKIKLLNVEKPRSMSEIDIDIWKDVRFTVEIDDEEYELAAIFCDNKVVGIVNASIVDAWYKLDENSAKVEEKNDEEKEEDVDYEAILEKFLAACASEDDMNDFVDEYVDIKSMYVADKIDEPSEFEDEYKKTKAKDYEDYADDVKEVYSSFVSEDTELTLKKVGKATKMSEIGIDMWSDVRFTVESDGETVKLAAIFCGDKLVLISDEDTVDSLYENLKEKEENVTNTSKNTTNDTSNNTTNKTSNSSSDDEEE